MAGRKPTRYDPVVVLRREIVKEDEDYIYEDIYTAEGCIHNRHPKHPKKPKEEVFKEIAPLLMKAWLGRKKHPECEKGAAA